MQTLSGHDQVRSNRPAMTDNDHRQIARDSLFVMADLRIDGIEGEHRIRVRNLSAGGLMAEGGPDRKSTRLNSSHG